MTSRWPKTIAVYSLPVLEARVWNPVVGRALLPPWPYGRILPISSSLWGLQVFLGLWLHPITLPLTSQAFSPHSTPVCFLSVSYLLIRTLGIGFTAHLDNPGWSRSKILHYICKDLFLKYSCVLGGYFYPNAEGFIHNPGRPGLLGEICVTSVTAEGTFAKCLLHKMITGWFPLIHPAGIPEHPQKSLEVWGPE